MCDGRELHHPAIGAQHLAVDPAAVRAGEEEWYAGRTIRRLTKLPVRYAGMDR